MREDPLRDRRMGEEGEQLPRSAAVGADERVGTEHAAQQFGPRVVAAALLRLPARDVRRARSGGAVVAVPIQVVGSPRPSPAAVDVALDPVTTDAGGAAPAADRSGTKRSRYPAAGANNAVVGDEVLVRSRHDRAKSLEERQRIEHDVGRAITPALLQRVVDAAVGQHGEPVVGDGRACDVVDQVFETIGSVGGDAGRGVQREAVEVVAEAVRKSASGRCAPSRARAGRRAGRAVRRRRSLSAPKRRGPVAGRSPARGRRVRRVQPALPCCATTAAPRRLSTHKRVRGCRICAEMRPTSDRDKRARLIPHPRPASTSTRARTDASRRRRSRSSTLPSPRDCTTSTLLESV